MTNFKHASVLFLTLLAFPVLVPQVQAASLPTVLSLEKRLENEIDKMIGAGHLRPGYHNAHEKLWRHQGSDVPSVWDDYWSNPAFTIYALLRALPHLPLEKQKSLRAYIQKEWNDYPPYLYTHCGWRNGAQREAFDIPQETFILYASGNVNRAYGQRLDPGIYDKWRGFSFNPFNIYACFLYAKEFGAAKSMLSRLSRKVAQYPSSVADGGTALTRRPHLLNMYLAGYEGYLNLQALAGAPLSETVRSWRESAYRDLISILTTTRLEDLRQTEAGGFLYLVPEVAEGLNSRLTASQLSQIRASIERYDRYSAPYWFVAGMDEVERLGPRESSQIEEGSTSLYYDYWSLFNAKALLLRESESELELYLDAPAVWRGDLFYVLNLINTIEASEESSESRGEAGSLEQRK